MNAETAAIARRLVACKRWQWLPGMVACRMCGDECVTQARIDELGESVDHPGMALNGMETACPARFPLHGRIPDLDDELTRAGVLPVVRRALGVPTLSTYLLGISDPDWGETIPEWRLAGIPDSTPYLWKVSSASEIDVLCRALESAQ